MVSRAALIENLKKADILKEKSLSCQNINNMDIWTNQRKLLNIYEEILIVDLEYALDRKVEQDLWNYCFKNYIALLQSFAKDKKVSGNGGLLQAKLSWFLECASGFYLSLLQQISNVFSLDLPFNRCDGLYGVLDDGERERWKRVASQPKRNSCYYMCQYCLVHLGDIARYRNHTVQAQSFYKQAVGVGPWSGQPYNQLALLGACNPDRLSTVFYYVRSIAVARPFLNAITNLTNTLAKSINYRSDETVTEGKVSASDYENLLLKLVAHLHSSRLGPEIQSVLSTLGPALTPLIATQQFTPSKLIQMCAVSIWLWEGECSGGSVGGSTTSVASGGGSDHSGSVEEIMSEYISGFLTSLLLPLYTASSDTLLSYFALPPVKVVLSWLECNPSAVGKMNKPSLWRGVCKLLNDLRVANPIPPPHNINDALPEDFDLRGFLPLDKALQDLNYEGDEMDISVERKLRAFRLIKLGEWLANSAPHKPIFIRDCQFEPVPMALSPPNCDASSASSPQPKPSNIVPQEFVRPKMRQNVALQSIMRLSNPVQREVDWQVQQGRASSVLSSDPRWWPPGPPIEELPTWTGGSEPDQTSQNQEGRMYSLFSGGDGQMSPASSLAPSILKHQSLWSGPGPSPLERLLQQQKNQRTGGHAPDT